MRNLIIIQQNNATILQNADCGKISEHYNFMCFGLDWTGLDWTGIQVYWNRDNPDDSYTIGAVKILSFNSLLMRSNMINKLVLIV